MGINKKMELFIGPCVLESKGLVDEIVGHLKSELGPLSDKIKLSFKGSFDKANRTAIDSYRGPGIEKGLELLEYVASHYGMTTVTDFHIPSQADEVASVVHTLQIPAFLCRQTDMIIEGAKAAQKYGRDLKIKKGQFMAPHETGNIVDKACHFIGREKILLTERGSCFGYNNLIVDMTSFLTMKAFGVRTIHDATHCVQLPGGLGKTSGGKREHILTLARAAIAAGADGLFMECHPRPSAALSDAATSLALTEVRPMVENLLSIFEVTRD